MAPTLKGAAALLSLISPAISAIIPRQAGGLPAVTVRGNAFFAGDERFYVRGVAYQPGGAADAKDPLLDIPSLKRDIEQFEKLGINTIRVYTVDNSENHDEAMRMLDDAGIYLALDANTPDYSLNRADAASLHASYNDVYLQNIFATIDAFAGYSNLLLMFSGNEVINEKNNTIAAPYIKAVTRDMKAYIAAQASRPIPIGYSAADVAENIEQQARYFDCGTEAERGDFFAFNDYSWCDPSSFKISGWDQKVKTYSDFNKPIFLSEFGCITNQRDWGEIEALYSTQMTGVYSGGLVYEYSLEENGYGLVEIQANGRLRILSDFTRLAQAYKDTANPTGNGGFRSTGGASQCPAQSEDWEVASTLLPAIPVPAEKFLDAGAGRGAGLEGDGSQWKGTPSETDMQTAASVEGGNSGGDGGESDKPNAASSIYGGIVEKCVAATVAAFIILAL